MRISSILVYVATVASLALVCGCASTSNSPYRDPTEVRGSGTRFTSYDFQQCAITLVDSMLSNAGLERRHQWWQLCLSQIELTVSLTCGVWSRRLKPDLSILADSI